MGQTQNEKNQGLVLNVKAQKGKYGYLNNMHLFSALRFGVFGGFSLFLVLCGRLFFTRYAGLFTLLAVISAVPAALSVVSLIMYSRFKTGREEIRDMAEELRGSAPVFYDSVITTPDKSYGVNCFIAVNKNLIGYSEYDKVDVHKLEKHLNVMAKKNGYKEWTIKVFTDIKPFSERLKFLKDKNVKPLNKDYEMIELVRALSL